MKVYELVKAIGEDAAIAMAEAFAGTRIHIPKVIPDDHEIAITIGRAAADRLVAYYGFGILRVPLMRELRILHYRRKGMTDGHIATRLGMVEPSVRKALDRIKEASPELVAELPAQTFRRRPGPRVRKSGRGVKAIISQFAPERIADAAAVEVEAIMADTVREIGQCLAQANDLHEFKAMLITLQAQHADNPAVQELASVIERVRSDAFQAGQFDEAEQAGSMGHA